MFGKISSTKKDISSMTEVCIDIFRTIVLAINNALGTDLPLFLNSTDPIDKCYATLYKLRKEMSNGIISDYDFAQCAYVLREEVELIMRSTQEMKVRDSCSYLLSCLRPILSYCDTNINPNNGPRTEPLTIMICGPSGVGKSTFTMPVLLALMAKVLKGNDLETFMENHNELIFYRANENEFWDGYKNKQKIIVYDDFGQRRDTSGSPNPDAFEWIRLKNTAPAHLHFSSIVDKSKHYAVPNLIYGTTNRFKLHFDSIVSNEAVIRRFDVAVIQVPKLEFCKDPFAESPNVRRLDMDKLRQVYPFDPEDPETFAVCDAIEFIEWDFSKGCIKDAAKTWNFDEFINYCSKRYVELHNKGDNMLKFHRFIKGKYVPQMDTDLSDKVKEQFDQVEEASESRLKEAINHTCKLVDEKFSHFKIVASESTKTFFRFLSNNAVICGAGAVMAGLVLHLWDASKIQQNYDKSKKEVRDARQSARKARARGAIKRSNNRSRSGKSVKEARSRVLTREQVKAGLHPDYYLQATSNPVSFPNHDFMVKLLRRNLYSLTLNDDGKHRGFALFLSGTTFIMPYHYVVTFDDMMAKMPEDETLMLTFCNPLTKNHCFEFDWSDDCLSVEPSNNEDWVYIKLPKGTCREHANIVECFPLKNKFIDGYNYECIMPVLRNELLQTMNTVVKIGDSIDYVDEVRTYCSRQLTYSAPTCVGDCGTPLISCDPRFGRPSILGFHVAGSGNSVFLSKACLGVSIHREDIIEAFEALEEDCPLLEEEIECDFNVEMTGFNALSKSRQPRMPNKSKLQPSPFYGKLWPVTMAPAMLKTFVNNEGVKIDPAEKAAEKYIHKEVYIPADVVAEMKPVVKQMILTRHLPEPWKPRVFQFEEAVAGIDGVQYVDAVSRSTSPGYPFNLDSKMKGKQYWLGTDGKIQFDTKECLELREMVDNCIMKAKNGIRTQHVFVDYLKDEKRPIEKVEMGKTRQFMACDMILLIVYKMYFGDFIRHVCQKKFLMV